MTNPLILIVEDDELFRSTIATLVNEKGYQSLEAEDGEAAKQLINKHPCDLIISDIQMPKTTGVELAEWLNQNSNHLSKKPQLILMTGFSHIKETIEAHLLGVSHFLAKPFNEDDLWEAINDSLNPERENSDFSSSSEKQKFHSISTDELSPNKNIDIYIKLGEKKYIKIAHKNGEMSSERVEVFKKKGITQLYITKEDFDKFYK